PTYNEEKNIGRCLMALCNQSIPRDHLEIIVVDGGSSDRTREIAANYADVVMMQTSEGVGGARNDGFKAAKYDIVATTDADCEPTRDWAKSILKQFMGENVVAVTGTLKPFDWKDMNRFEVFAYKRSFELANIALNMGAKVGNYHLCGANTAFNKDTFLETGGYLPLAYADDVEIFKRIKNRGDIRFTDDMEINYSVRRIKKMGLTKYIYSLAKMQTEVMVLGRKPMKGDYARLNYD
ncbi:glycosyltransferase family 2 protein, partial [Candidatus Bathyarchaeota archaeon]